MVTVTALALLATPAQAGLSAFPTDHDFEGRAERDPSTYVGFDLVRKDGERKVARFTAYVHYACDDGDVGTAGAKAKGKLDVSANGRFAGVLKRRVTPPLDRGGTVYRVRYDIRGRLEGKRAKGKLDAEIRFVGGVAEPRGGEQVRCYSGRVDWKTRRGADAEIGGPPL